MNTWTEVDFENMGWHDNHVHGIMIRQGQYGSGDLVLDLDYILEWNCPTGEESYQFLVAPATLTFLSMTQLKITVDYVTPSAGITPFSLHGIEREIIKYSTGQFTYAWRLPINWPTGEITFQAQGYKQVLRADPIWHNEMYLESKHRASL